MALVTGDDVAVADGEHLVAAMLHVLFDGIVLALIPALVISVLVRAVNAAGE